MRWWRPRGGPDRAHAPAARPGIGFDSSAATPYRFVRSGVRDLTAAFPDLVGRTIAPGTELRYAVLPEWGSESGWWRAVWAAVVARCDVRRIGGAGRPGDARPAAATGDLDAMDPTFVTARPTRRPTPRPTPRPTAQATGRPTPQPTRRPTGRAAAGLDRVAAEAGDPRVSADGAGRRTSGAAVGGRASGGDTSPTAPTTGRGSAVGDAAGRGATDPFAADAVALDLVFTDGGRLSELGPVDQYGVGLDPRAQHSGAMAHPDQWHLVRVALDAAAGRTVARVELVFAETRTRRSGEVRGWLDSAAIAPVPDPPTRPVEWARTRQGTHSSDRLSRGGCAPSVGVPHGFVSGIPVTNAGEIGWPYAWHADSGPDGRPALQAFATSRLPSPWMGERGAFQIMPALAGPAGDPVAGAPRERALSFDHADEIAHPHRYRVALDGGIEAELTATDHVVLMRFRFPEGAREGVLVFDQIRGDGVLRLPDAPAPAGAAVTGLTRDERSVGVDRRASPPYHLCAQLDRPVVAAGMLPRFGAGDVRGWVRVALGPDRTVVVRAATSAIGADQAARSIRLDGADAPFDEVVERAAASWDAWISRIELDGATPEQRSTMATALSRVGMFPRRGHEDLGVPGAPAPHYASPFDPAAPITAGELSVDQGFWDVYRTAWPLLSLLDPAEAARLLDGFVEHYRASGWTSRWSAPGPIDSMTGTSSDVVFAHAVAAGVPIRTGAAEGPDDHRLDLWSAYDSALRNATVPSDDARVGRKGLARSIFRGWVDTRVHEGLSWTLDGALGDLAVAHLARALADRVGGEHPRAAELAASVSYFTARAGAYAASFDARVGFFQGRRPDGSFRHDPERYDPEVWGHDYTETNGWGTAFSAPHDGAGLATLHGGPAALAERIERMLTLPETASWGKKGSYPVVIHEMVEARNLRFGQWAPSNQPAHHIPFMALFAGRPDLAQRLVHEAATRLFGGGEIGQGWPGDEDNGEMSAWWIFAALGLYPLVPGTAGYVLTAPIVPAARLRLGEGRMLRIEAPGAGRDRPYVAGVTIDGAPWRSTFVPHDVLSSAGVVRFELSDRPQPWGTDAGAQPPSLTPPGERPVALCDLTRGARVVAVVGGGEVDAGGLVDDDSGTPGVRLEPGDAVEIVLAETELPTGPEEPDGRRGGGIPGAPEILTVTPRHPGVVAFRCERVEDDERATVVFRGVEAFRWERQTRPFLLEGAGASARWRWVAESPVELVQLELLRRARVG